MAGEPAKLMPIQAASSISASEKPLLLAFFRCIFRHGSQRSATDSAMAIACLVYASRPCGELAALRNCLNAVLVWSTSGPRDAGVCDDTTAFAQQGGASVDDGSLRMDDCAGSGVLAAAAGIARRPVVSRWIRPV